ncbi:hypothetical protein [Janibacter cremeus]|uniref:Uncharacterized protein n=1 Tax=Janibacter cremeus TaxID=1285192 RepID=A0A852W031_9MICO|nr:hypothetical protein [Janibacter cremeus]NYF99335.1 hypothetical protein [Janibacter cremeus]
MSVFAILLVAIGVADLARSIIEQRSTREGDATRWRVHRIGTEAGIVSLWFGAALAGLLTTTSGWLLVALATVSLAAWLLVSGWALTRDRGHVIALSTLAGGLVAQLALAGWAPQAGGALARWITWADLPWSPEPGRALLIAGLALVQLSTGNLIVRLVLISTGAMAPGPPIDRTQAADRAQEPDQPSDTLKGGRLLGPLERIFILGLGLAGQVTAAGIVIAAKGLIRWPELRSYARPGSAGGRHSDIDTVTEYFLVGSFVSWLVALGALVLAL